MEASARLRALNPFKIRPKFCGSFTLGCSSSSFSTKIPTGKEMGRRAYDGLLLDAANTLLQLTKPVEETYAVIGKKYGLTTSPAEIKHGFKRAFAAPWPENLRYQDDGRPFWKLVVSEATGCSDDTYFEEVYQHYASGEAWHLPPGAYDTILILKRSGGYQVSALLHFLHKICVMNFSCHPFVSELLNLGTVKLAVVSNFDTRLRKILKDLNVLDLFDAVIISSEVGHEKPDIKIFRAALDQISVEGPKTVHVGDDEKADKGGANAAGIDCWLWGVDVKSFADIQNRFLTAP